MRGRREERIEAAIDRLAAAILASAVAFAVFRLGRAGVPQPQLGIAAVACAAAAYLVAVSILRRVAAERPRFEVPVFAIADPSFVEPEELLLIDEVELVLTDADRLPGQRSASPAAEELLLDDILAELGPDSRVVRLFDRAAMPTPAQLNARIAAHLRGDAAPPEPVDASEALHQALAELRRSLC
jgi:hypothetical protein